MDAFLTWLSWAGAAVAVVVFFGLSIFVHEFFHYLAARMCGFRIDEFSIGFGKAIWKKKVGATVYKIGWIPLGGYVMLPQLDPAGMELIQGGAEGSAGHLPPAAWWKRIIVSVAGAVGNLVFACLLAMIIWTLPPSPTEDLRFEGAVVGYAGKGSEAALAGLRPGDRILAVNGAQVGSWGDFATEAHLGAVDGKVALAVSNIIDGAVADLSIPVGNVKIGLRTMHAITNIMEAHCCAVGMVSTNSPAERAGLKTEDMLISIDGCKVVAVEHAIDLIRGSGGNPIKLEIRRAGRLQELTLTPEILPETKAFGIGVVLVKYDVSPPMWMRHRNPVDQINGDVKSIKRILKALVTPRETSKAAGALSGPVVIFPAMWAFMLSGIFSALSFVRFLNMNLALLNLLPIPVLDGGHVLFALWRGITGREVPGRLSNALVNIFAILLITVFLLLTVLDASMFADRLFGRRGDAKDGEPDATEQAAPSRHAAGE